MKYSYHWLQEHIADPLPPVEDMVRTITIKAFEVEGVEQEGGDTIFDIKVLPDRAHDALSHRGMAREIASLFGLKHKEHAYPATTPDPTVSPVRVALEDPVRCLRYMAVRVEGITVKPSSELIRTKLESIGARAINNIVDYTNIVLFDLGQPMHAFDAEKVAGGITVRLAKAGETMTTLDGKALTFDGTELVIADDEGVLALAGVKGGKKAEVNAQTTSIILECANFDATTTRATSTKHGIKTDASKRYENGMTSAFAEEAMCAALGLLKESEGNVRVGVIADHYALPEAGDQTLGITIRSINQLLGSSMGASDMEEILVRLNWKYEKRNAGDALDHEYCITIPIERFDLRIKEDLIEEIGRQYGYEKIPGVLPALARKGLPHKRFYYADRVRNFLVAQGFSEVFTYSFAKPGDGEIEVQNPVGKDRPLMRSHLTQGIRDALARNTYYAPLLGLPAICIFEIGNIFAHEGEHMHLALGMTGKNKKDAATLPERGHTLRTELIEYLGVTQPIKGVEDESLISGVTHKPFIWEIDFDALIAALPDPTQNEDLAVSGKGVVYRTLSAYPFMVRDIALFVPASVPETLPGELIRSTAGSLAVACTQFDKFQKPGEDRISYAYRIIFQSFERTLTDDEVNAIMERVTARLQEEPNWEVR